MKYVKNYSLFESNSSPIDDFYEIFQEIKDMGFNIEISERTSRKLNLETNKKYEIDNLPPTSDGIETVNTIIVNIEKKISPQDNTRSFGWGLNLFDFSELEETLKFIESYARDEMRWEIEYIYIWQIPKYYYLKSVDDLDLINGRSQSISIAFSKIN